MGDLLLIYRRLTTARIRSDYQYRTSFWLFTFGQFVITFFDFVAIAIIFGQVNDLAGWSLNEVAFLYGLTCVSFALADMGISQVEDIADRIRLGTFDLLLTRPLSPLFQVAADDFALRRIGKVLQGAVVLGIAMNRLPVEWTAARLAFVAVTIVSGAVIYGSVWVVTATISFFTVDSQEVSNAFTYGGNYMSQYPLPIYGVWLRRVLAFAIPLAFVSYFPAVGILGKDDPLGAPAALHYAAPLVALLGIGVARTVWQFGIRHYRSTGS